jgi:hypothetical protein
VTKYLFDLYQVSIEKKGKNAKANFTLHKTRDDDDNDDDDANPKYVNVDIIHLDVANAFEYPEEEIDHLIGDDGVHKN